LAKRACEAPSSADVCVGLAVQPAGRSDGTSSSLASAAFSAAVPVPATVLALAVGPLLVLLLLLLVLVLGAVLAAPVAGVVVLPGVSLPPDEQAVSRATAVSVPSAAAARTPREICIGRL
jgi:hypothetical protein